MSDYAALCERLYRQNEFAIKLGTERTRAALDAVGAPDRAFRSILVAGTNGKGSVASLLHAGLIARGRRVGLFTSPHLVEIRERLRVDGAPISEADFVRLGRATLQRFGSSEVPTARRLTYFELVTVMALRYFAEQNVEIAVLEVGLGGRLDASNAVEPDLSVITPVALDHQKHLGDDIASILREKAGVLRRGKPAVACRPVGWTTEQTRAALAPYQAEPLLLEGEAFEAAGEPIVSGRGLGAAWIPFAGAHQIINAATAVTALYHLEAGGSGDAATPQDLVGGLRRARWPGRWQAARWNEREIWLDGAHNPHACESAARHIAQLGERVTAVMAVVRGKQSEAMLRVLAPRLRRVIAAPLDNPRALAASELADGARELGIETVLAQSLADAMGSATTYDEPIVVLGSLYLVGAVLVALGRRAEDLPVLAPLGASKIPA